MIEESALKLIKDLITLRENEQKNCQQIINVYESNSNHFFEKWKKLEAENQALKAENDALRMELATAKAENKKGFKQSKK